jgi:hypothetical protein
MLCRHTRVLTLVLSVSKPVNVDEVLTSKTLSAGRSPHHHISPLAYHLADIGDLEVIHTTLQKMIKITRKHVEVELNGVYKRIALKSKRTR